MYTASDAMLQATNIDKPVIVYETHFMILSETPDFLGILLLCYLDFRGIIIHVTLQVFL